MVNRKRLNGTKFFIHVINRHGCFWLPMPVFHVYIIWQRWLSPRIIKLWDRKLMKPNRLELSTTESSPLENIFNIPIISLSSHDNFIFCYFLLTREIILTIICIYLCTGVRWRDFLLFFFKKLSLSNYHKFILKPHYFDE